MSYLEKYGVTEDEYNEVCEAAHDHFAGVCSALPAEEIFSDEDDEILL